MNITEKLLQKYTTPTETVKRVITETFDELLSRFPLFYVYWKKYTALQYQMSGLETSLATLSNGLDVFPTSLDLWIDYLTLLCSNHNDEQDHIDKIRSEFETAVGFVGHQFLSHPLWDKYIEFEKSQNDNLKVLNILLRVVRIPLHQYARYYQSLTEIKDKVPLESIMDLDPELHNIIDSNPDQDKNTLLTNHISRICTDTYTYVTKIWPYEAKVAQLTSFTLIPLDPSVVSTWEEYLDFMIAKHTASPSELNKKQVISLFERSLVPTALETKLWLKYIKWVSSSLPSDTDLLQNIYHRAVNLYVPVDIYSIRLSHALFLEINDKSSETINELYLNTIKSNPAEPAPIIHYVQYVTRVNKNSKRTADWLNQILNSRFKSGKTETELTIYEQRIADLLNDKTAGVLVAELIKILWYQCKDHTALKIHFSFYSKQESLFGSVPFWSIYYKYQRSLGDRTSLSKVVAFIKNSSALPLTLINAILLDYADYLQQNPEATASTYKRVLELEYDAYNALHYRLVDDKQRKRFKGESGHPSVFIEKPTVTNTSIGQLVDRFKPSSLPTFKNVEKAALPIEYAQNE